MENASKALLMAAGVLIGILILSLGVYLFINFSQNARQTYNQIQADQINQFNSEFVTLQGKSNITIYDVVSAIKRAREFNQVNGLQEGEDNYIEATLSAGTTLMLSTEMDDGDFDDNVQILIDQDRENMTPVPDADGNEIIRLPPYLCEIKGYNDLQRVNNVSFQKTTF